MTGEWPPEAIHHKDTDRTNNAWRNLRACSGTNNAKNRKLYATNRSGIRGVSWYPRLRKWRTVVSLGQGRKQHVGYFSTLAEAATAREAAAQIHYGEFAPG